MMRKITLSLLIVSALAFSSCKRDKIAPAGGVSFNFTHWVGSEAVEMNNIKYNNAAGNNFSITKLQYVISDIKLKADDGSEVFIDEYHFVDIEDTDKLTFTPESEIAKGDYTSMSFVFGLAPSKNVTGAHQDLNAESWGWPDESSPMANLGGGYHFMKLEGKFINSDNEERSYATHMGTARQITATDTIFHDNHVNVSLNNVSVSIEDVTSIEIKMDIAEWYTNPTDLDINDYGGSAMPNYTVQTTLRANGASAFALGAVE